MKLKQSDFNSEYAASISKEAFIKEHSGSHPGVTDADLAEVHKKCCDEQGVKPVKDDKK
jgi:hypothetical protein